MDWSIQDIAGKAGTTSRTLRHYGAIGLLEPSRIGSNGYRYYDERALVRLQRILMLRELGLGLPAIGEVLEHETDESRALRAHLGWLRKERERIDRQIGSVENTIDSLKGREPLMAENMFDGFDHTEHREEVEQRWGKASYAAGDAWWRGMSAPEKATRLERSATLGADWKAAARAGLAPDSVAAQALAQRHVDWLRGVPGTPTDESGGPAREYLLGLAELYVADERFAANYGGADGATFVRAALIAFADEHL